jgi:hypothetical protein
VRSITRLQSRHIFTSPVCWHLESTNRGVITKCAHCAGTRAGPIGLTPPDGSILFRYSSICLVLKELRVTRKRQLREQISVEEPTNPSDF